MNLHSRLAKLEQKQINQFISVDVTKMSNQELNNYIEELGQTRIITGKYKGRKLGELSNQQLCDYEEELLRLEK